MLITHVERYVALHRSLGLCFDTQERLLTLYARFASAAGDAFVTTQRVRAWASNASSPGQARVRYDTVRRFAAFLKAERTAAMKPRPQGPSGRAGGPAPRPTC